MRKLILLTVFFLGFVPFFALDVDMTVGVQTGVLFDWRNYKYDADADNFDHIDTNTSNFAAGVWFDMEYARLSVDYAFTFDGNIYHDWEVLGIGSNSNDALPTGWSQQELLITLIGKYPYAIGEMILSPQVGIAFRTMMDFDTDGDGNSEIGETNYEELNDFYFVLGGGLELPVNTFVVIFDAQYNINMTANPSSDPLNSTESYFWNNLKLNLGLGFKI